MSEFIQREQSLYFKHRFRDFPTAVLFLSNVASLAERHNHHPRMTVDYDLVELELTTHDEGNKITEKDLHLAVDIMNLFRDIFC